jgi:hypothetical protein
MIVNGASSSIQTFSKHNLLRANGKDIWRGWLKGRGKVGDGTILIMYFSWHAQNQRFNFLFM